MSGQMLRPTGRIDSLGTRSNRAGAYLGAKSPLVGFRSKLIWRCASVSDHGTTHIFAVSDGRKAIRDPGTVALFSGEGPLVALHRPRPFRAERTAQVKAAYAGRSL